MNAASESNIAPNTQVRMTAIVSGHVQGVGYRAFVRSQATDLLIAGQVENLPDGRVEVIAEGLRGDIELLLVRMRTGPAHSAVSAIDVEWGQPGGMRGFYVY